jgi:uncharacterized protein YndB with AHSA1/START domain
MSLHKEPSGRRSVQVEVEVPGTPEEVWQAIATGPGISSWFVPSDVQGHIGGTVVAHFGPGLDSVATITEWQPPERFAAESQDLGPHAPALATQWFVEAREGGVCLVRVVHSLFASTDDWDDQLESVEGGWPTFFRILRLYLSHFAGQACAIVPLVAVAKVPRSQAWKTLTEALGLAGVRSGERWTASTDAPPASGIVQEIGAGKNHFYALVRLDKPTGGACSLIVNTVGEAVYAQVSCYYYGTQATDVAEREAPHWRAGIEKLFPATAANPKSETI